MIRLKDLLVERDHPSIYKELKKPASDLANGEKKLSEAIRLLDSAERGMPKELEEIRAELRKINTLLSKASSDIDVVAGEVGSELRGTPMKPEFKKLHGLGGYHHTRN